MTRSTIEQRGWVYDGRFGASEVFHHKDINLLMAYHYRLDYDFERCILHLKKVGKDTETIFNGNIPGDLAFDYIMDLFHLSPKHRLVWGIDLYEKLKNENGKQG